MPTGTELVRPFLPTKDFEASIRFYVALGFELTLDSEVATFKAGSGGFILQRHFGAPFPYGPSQSTSNWYILCGGTFGAYFRSIEKFKR